MRVLPFASGTSIEGSTGFTARALIIMFQTSRGGPGQQVLIDSRWLEQAELVIVRWTQAGSVERRLEIPNLPIRLNQ